MKIKRDPLTDCLDKEIKVILKDGHILIGKLIDFDKKLITIQKKKQARPLILQDINIERYKILTISFYQNEKQIESKKRT